MNRCPPIVTNRGVPNLYAALIGMLVLMNLAAAFGAPVSFVPSAQKPPPVPREFRGVWVASVKNIDWPSQPGLTTAQQKAELIALLDRAAQLKLNAVLLQIRPSCDALYNSKLEPWSEYLTGRMGQPPAPFYDPLAFAVDEAHKRGLELHAWFNPFRARHASGISPMAKSHISQTRPTLAKVYGKSLWLDPGEREVQEHSLRVVLDVVQRYDIDGVHFDDYFYPYEEKDLRGQPLPFPDWSSWKRYRDGGGGLTKEDWRRQNVNTFVLRTSKAIKAEKPWLKFGISPFGIWRPGYPKQIRGLDAYNSLYADARKWFIEGWVDYLAPQLYWPTSQPQQSFPVLLNWWAEQNPKGRHLWPGLALSNEPLEIVNQIRLTRNQGGAKGNILWNARTLMQNRQGIADKLSREVYAESVLTPSFPWLDPTPPATPRISANHNGKATVHWTAGDSERPVKWILQTRRNATWSTEFLPGNASSKTWSTGMEPEAVALTAVDRVGLTSVPTVLERRTETPNPQPPGGR